MIHIKLNRRATPDTFRDRLNAKDRRRQNDLELQRNTIKGMEDFMRDLKLTQIISDADKYDDLRYKCTYRRGEDE